MNSPDPSSRESNDKRAFLREPVRAAIAICIILIILAIMLVIAGVAVFVSAAAIRLADLQWNFLPGQRDEDKREYALMIGAFVGLVCTFALIGLETRLGLTDWVRRYGGLARLTREKHL